MEPNTNNLIKALDLCLSTDHTQRNEGQNFIQTARNYSNYSPNLLQISSDSKLPKEIQQIAAVQLKNFIFKNWEISQEDSYDKNKQTEILKSDKEIIKSAILNVLPNMTNRANFKLFLQIIRLLLKYEVEWKEFLPTIVNYLKSEFISRNSLDSNLSNGSLLFLCGVEIFYQMSKCYEFEIDHKKEIYNNCFDLISEFLENFVEKFLSQVSYNPTLFRVEDNIDIKILYKIFKIFYRSIQLGLPSSLMKPEKFEKWMKFFFFIMKLTFEGDINVNLIKLPQTVEDLQNLRKNMLWKIKYTAFNIIFKIYEKYSDPSKIGKKETKLKNFAGHVDSTYSKPIFEIFIHTLFNQSKEKYLQVEIICLIYQFLQLILNRSNTNMIKLLQQNLEILVKDYIIFNNMLDPTDLEAIKFNEREYIYQQFENGMEFENKSVAIKKFLVKLCEFKLKKKSRPVYVDSVYSSLVSSLELIDKEVKEFTSINNLNENNHLYYILLKDSCINLLEGLHNVIAEYYPDNVQDIIARFISNDIKAQPSNNIAIVVLRERALGFIQGVSSIICYKDEYLIRHIAECTLMNLFSTNFEDNLAISVRAALNITALLHSHPIVKEIFKTHIANICSIFLKLIQILDLDELIKCLEKLVSAYKDEVIEFSVELTRELINFLEKYHKEDLTESEDNYLNDYNSTMNYKNGFGSDDEVASNSSSSSDEPKTNSAFSFVLKTINRLINIAGRKEPFDTFYQIESLVIPVLTWGLNSNINSILKEIIEIMYSILNSNVPVSYLTWSIYPEVLKTLIVYKQENNTSSNNLIEPGTGFDHLQETVTIILNFIVKDPDNFYGSITNQSGNRPIDLTINIISHLIFLSRQKFNDEINCSYVFKILITILETYKEKLDYLLKDILSFVISELKQPTQFVYKSILFQTIALSYVYNPKLTNQILEEMNLTGHLFELWVSLIGQMKFDFEFRRSLMAFTSLLLVDNIELSQILRENMGFILNKILFFCRKLNEIREKQKEKEEAEVSGDEGDDSDSYEKEYELKSKTKNFKWQLKDFIVDDLNDDDDDDEDYNELEHSFEGSGIKFKTNLDSQDEFIYLRDVMNYLRDNNLDYYNHLMMLIADNDKVELSQYITKAEIRLAEKRNIN